MKMLCVKILMPLAVLSLSGMPAAFANSVVLNQDAYSYDVGGEFSAVTSQNFLNNYASSTIVGGGFETFCIETTVDFTPGQTYTYNLSSVDSLGRNLTEGTAFLYYEFAKGVLSGYDYNIANDPTDAADRKADAGELQAAIWWLQGNQTYGDGQYTVPTIANNAFYALAISTLGSNATSANDGIYGVEVLQMWNANGAAAQNQLVLVPDGGMTVALLGMSLAGMCLVQFRLRKHSPVPSKGLRYSSRVQKRKDR
jgi:hypothetical protein